VEEIKLFMVRRNYRAWHVPSKTLDESLSNLQKMRHFAQYGVLAPSGHNSQPWQLTFRDDALLVAVNQHRHLSGDGSGLLSVEPYISIGAFVETTVLAAHGLGYRLAVELFPSERHIARLTIADKVPAQPPIIDAILSRSSNRHAFQNSRLEHEVLADIATKNFDSITKTIITKRADIDFMAEVSMTGTAGIMQQKGYRKELSKWVRTNLTRKFEGMPGFTHGIHGAKSIVAKPAVRYIRNQKPLVNNIGNLVRNSAALIIVRCANDDLATFLNAGRQYVALSVNAQKNGVASSAVGASVLNQETSKLVCERFLIKDRPVFVLRFGLATITPAHSPRLPVELVTTDEDG
jgi:nitroreductase